jgi:hypothetical protein
MKMRNGASGVSRGKMNPDNAFTANGIVASNFYIYGFCFTPEIKNPLTLHQNSITQ